MSRFYLIVFDELSYDMEFVAIRQLNFHTDSALFHFHQSEQAAKFYGAR